MPLQEPTKPTGSPKGALSDSSKAAEWAEYWKKRAEWEKERYKDSYP